MNGKQARSLRKMVKQNKAHYNLSDAEAKKLYKLLKKSYCNGVVKM